MTVASIITQVHVKSSAGSTINEKKSKQHLSSLLSLSLRGTRVDIDKNTLVMIRIFKCSQLTFFVCL